MLDYKLEGIVPVGTTMQNMVWLRNLNVDILAVEIPNKNVVVDTETAFIQQVLKYSSLINISLKLLLYNL